MLERSSNRASLAGYLFLLLLAIGLQVVLSSQVDCVFVYQEIPGGTEIPGLPVAVKEDPKALPDCPPGLYDEETWPLDGCKQTCNKNLLSFCIAFGFVTDEKAVLHMSCAGSYSGTNPDGSNVEDCQENGRWIEDEVKMTTATTDATNTTGAVVSAYECHECHREDLCISEFWLNYTGPTASSDSTTGTGSVDAEEGPEASSSANWLSGRLLSMAILAVVTALFL